MHIFGHLNKRTLAISGLLIAVLAGVFFFWFSGRPSDEAPTITAIPASSLDVTLGRGLLVTLAKLKSTALDTSIFDDPVFASLKDFGIEIEPQPVGRRNPFAEFGDSTIVKPAASSPKTKTGAPTSGTAKPVLPKTPRDESGFDTEEGFDIE